MKKLKRVILISLLLVSGVAAVSFWVNLHGKKASEEEKKGPPFSADDAKMVLEKIHFVEDKQGKKTWELEAKSIRQNREENLMTLEDVVVKVYTEDGRSFTISGKQGQIHLDSKNIELAGDVVVTSNDGYQLKTQSVAYRHEEKKVGTSDPVEVEGEGLRLTGRGMVVDMGARTFTILGGVKTQLKGKGKV
jgi:LPS export ABC transporter protein LptC